MNLNQKATPILDKLKLLANTPDAAFYAPGHKRGQGVSNELINLMGNDVFKADLPELPELDNLFAPEGVILEAQQLASETFGADFTYFLINGSTCGIIAAIIATCNPRDKIILPRNVHKSVISGLILSGAIPVFINPIYDSNWDICYGISSESLADTLAKHPDSKAVFVIYPTYQGICCDLAKIAQITHQYNIPLLVDEAHGAHFFFHESLPPSALSQGADLAVQSTHKTLGSLTQSSMLHIKGDRINQNRLENALQLMQSTSPNYLLLASLDAARQQMAIAGQELMTKTLDLALQARSRLKSLKGLPILELGESQSSFQYLDLTRLTVDVTNLGLTGYEADEILHQKLGVTAELPMLNNLTFIISLGNTQADIDKLIDGFSTLITDINTPLIKEEKGGIKPCIFPNNTYKLSPRDAFFAPKKTRAIENSIGCISGELICPYPPGIPVLMLGEIITEEAINYLQKVISENGIITGCSDSSLTTIKIVDN
jgi:arginine decarboxylase